MNIDSIWFWKIHKFWKNMDKLAESTIIMAKNAEAPHTAGNAGAYDASYVRSGAAYMPKA